MLDLKTIIAPVDLSERSRVAVEHAVALRNQFGSNMVFVHVIPMLPDEHPVNIRGLYPEAHWHGFEDLNAKLYDQMKALIDPLSGGHESEKLVLTGDPVSEIKKLAGERSAGLIVMPTHGYGPFRRFLLGSVTSKILHDSDCPVMTGAHMPELPPIAAKPYQRIACAVGLEPHSETALRWAWEFAQASNATLDVIHAAPRLDEAMAYGEWFPAESVESVIESARRRVDELVSKVGCEAEVHVDGADPVLYVRDVAAETKADLLIVGRSPAGEHFRRNAFGLVRESPCPVISV